jgi:hypothetical protein
MLKPFVCIASVTLVSGCASTLGAFFNRPVVEDGIKEVVSTVSLAADRRTVVVVTKGANQSKFCAEPPPDTATGLKTELDLSAQAKGKLERAVSDLDASVNLKDKLQTEVKVIADRTAPLDAFRTGVYALCQYHLNGAIAAADVKPLFEQLIQAFTVTHTDATKKPSQ